MSISKHKHKNLSKNVEPIPVTEMTTSIGDHKRNNMNLIPIEQRYQMMIIEELKAIHETLKKR